MNINRGKTGNGVMGKDKLKRSKRRNDIKQKRKNTEGRVISCTNRVVKENT